jgi:hypothetical protein
MLDLPEELCNNAYENDSRFNQSLIFWRLMGFEVGRLVDFRSYYLFSKQNQLSISSKAAGCLINNYEPTSPQTQCHLGPDKLAYRGEFPE